MQAITFEPFLHPSLERRSGDTRRSLNTNRLLEGKVVLVTGGSSGIGRATAAVMARQGAAVVIADVNAAGGELAIEAIRREGGEASFVHTDVRDGAQIETALATPAEASLLGTDVGLPLLLLSRHSFDDDGQPIEWVRSLYRGDRYKFVARLHRPAEE